MDAGIQLLGIPRSFTSTSYSSNVPVDISSSRVIIAAFIRVNKISRMLESSRTMPLTFTLYVLGSHDTSFWWLRMNSKTAFACGRYLFWISFKSMSLLTLVALENAGGYSKRDLFFKTSSWLIKFIFSLLERRGLCKRCCTVLLPSVVFTASCSSKRHCLNKERGMMIDSELLMTPVSRCSCGSRQRICRGATRVFTLSHTAVFNAPK